MCSPKAAAPCGRPSRAFSTSGPEDVSACEPIHLLAWGRGGHVDTTSIEWPIQSQMQVNLAGEKKNRQSDEAAELGGCLAGWTDCPKQTVPPSWEEGPSPRAIKEKLEMGTPKCSRQEP